MRINKKTISQPISRRIPEADLRGFKPPEIVKAQTLQKSDVTMLQVLSRELKVTGVIDRDPEKQKDRQTLHDLGDIFSEAESHQKYEKDINPAFYDAEADAILEDRQVTEGDLFENPSLDGVDDYGSQVYDRFVEFEENENFVDDTERKYNNFQEGDVINNKTAAIRLPDGKIIYGELL